MPSPESTAGHAKQAKAESDADSHPEKKPENNERFRGVNPHRPAQACVTFFYPDYYCRPRNYTGSCLLYAAPVSQRRNCHCPKRLVGFTTDRELHPAPKVKYFVVKNYTTCGLLGLDDAIHRADGNALGRIVVTDALDTGGLVNHVERAIAFADGFGGAFGHARTAGDAIVLNLHGHGLDFLFNDWIYCVIKIHPLIFRVN
jgi:hypothetical protein